MQMLRFRLILDSLDFLFITVLHFTVLFSFVSLVHCTVHEKKCFRIVTEKNRHEMHAKFGKPVKLEGILLTFYLAFY